MEIILAFISAIIISWISIPAIIKLAFEKHLHDDPDEERKEHKESIPTLGGIAIFAGLIIASSYFVNFSKNPEFAYFISAIVILFFTGVKDDIIPLSPKKKFIAQLLAVLIIIIKGDVRLTSMYGVFGIFEIPEVLSVILTLFTLLVIVNAFNLIDGINGLAGGIAVITSLTFAFFFYQLEQINLVILSVTLAGAIVGFLYYNLRLKAKIFMGDTGSLIIGLILAILAIKFIDTNGSLALNERLFNPSFAAIFAFVILIIPLFDTLRVFIVRMSKGVSPFSPDRRHIHHLLVDCGLVHWQASVILYIVNIGFIFLAYSIRFFPAFIILLIVLSIASIGSLSLMYLKNGNQKKKLAIHHNS